VDQVILYSIFGVLLIVGIIYAIRFGNAETERRRAEWAAWATSKNFTYHDLPGVQKWYGTAAPVAPEELVGHFRPLIAAPSATCHRSHTGTVANRPVIFFESWYVVSTGKSSYTVYHTITTTPVKPGLPSFTIRKQGLWDNIKAFFGSHDILIGDEDFDNQFYISCSDENYIKLLLNTEAKSILRKRDAAMWRCKDGNLVVTEVGSLTPKNIDPLLDLTTQFGNLIDRNSW
jgi:hypothetical protein